MKKFISLLLVLTMICSLFVGCKKASDKSPATTADDNSSEVVEATATPEPTIDTSEHVKLKMYFLGSAPDDMDLVWDEINKKLTEKINVEIEPVILGWGDWQEKYPLLFASGENWDMIYTADWAFYAQQAAKGGFLELTQDMLNTYAPKTVAALKDAAWSTSKVNGKNYMIPANSKFAEQYGIVIRGDLREKYGLPEVKTVEDFEVFADKVLENESGILPLGYVGASTVNLKRALLLSPQEMFPLSDGTGEMVYHYSDTSKLDAIATYDVPGYLDYMKKMVEWRKKGYWSRSALTAEDQVTAGFTNGTSAAFIGNIMQAQDIYATIKANKLPYKMEYVDLTGDKKTIAKSFLGNGSAINANSQNPERALMALDLLGYDPEINMLVMQGIPGVHINNVGTEEVRKIENLKSTYGGSYSQWCFDNFETLPVDAFDGYVDYRDKFYNKQIVYHPALGFALNMDSIKTEVATVTQVIQQYRPIIELGFNDDPQATYDKYVKALKEAGIEKVNAEIQKQAQAVFDANSAK